MIMLRTSRLAVTLFALAAPLAACGGDAGDDAGDDVSDDDDDAGDLSLEGRYALDSTFDVTRGLPGDVGAAVEIFVEMSDDPDDPATFVLDMLAAELDSDLLEGLLEALRPGLDGMLNDEIMARSPDVVRDLRTVGDQLGQAMSNLAAASTLEVTAGGAASHALTGYGFAIDGTAHSYTLAELGADAAEVDGITVALAGSTMTLSEHAMPLRYGGLLGVALDEVIVPAIDAGAGDVGALLERQIDCDAIGVTLAAEIGLGGAALYQGACLAALGAAADAVRDRLAAVEDDVPARFVIRGEAKAADQDGDGDIDRLTAGTWAGTIDYSGDVTALPDAATFVGERVR
jgi:hypothetical protein